MIGNMRKGSALVLGMYIVLSEADLCNSRVPYLMPCTASFCVPS